VYDAFREAATSLPSETDGMEDEEMKSLLPECTKIGDQHDPHCCTQSVLLLSTTSAQVDQTVFDVRGN